MKFVEDFEKLDKSSFLYAAYIAVKDGMYSYNIVSTDQIYIYIYIIVLPEESSMLNGKFTVKSISGAPIIDVCSLLSRLLCITSLLIFLSAKQW